MKNPFTYYNPPTTRLEAQSNVNYWWYEGMEDCPSDTVAASWNVFMREMNRESKRQLSKFLIDNTSSAV